MKDQNKLNLLNFGAARKAAKAVKAASKDVAGYAKKKAEDARTAAKTGVDNAKAAVDDAGGCMKYASKKIDEAGAAVKGGAVTTAVKKIPGAEKLYQTSQNDRYEDSAFGHGMKAFKQAATGDLKSALTEAMIAKQAYDRDKTC